MPVLLSLAVGLLFQLAPAAAATVNCTELLAEPQQSVLDDASLLRPHCVGDADCAVRYHLLAADGTELAWAADVFLSILTRSVPPAPPAPASLQEHLHAVLCATATTADEFDITEELRAKMYVLFLNTWVSHIPFCAVGEVLQPAPVGPDLICVCPHGQSCVFGPFHNWPMYVSLGLGLVAIGIAVAQRNGLIGDGERGTKKQSWIDWRDKTPSRSKKLNRMAVVTEISRPYTQLRTRAANK